MEPDLGTLNIERPKVLRDYLRTEGYIAADESVSIKRLEGGVSNRTVLVDRNGKSSWVLKQALPKLRVEADWFCDPARIHREASGLRWLERLLPNGTTPRFVFEDFDHHLLAMEAVPRPYENWKSMLLEGALEEEHVCQFAQLLAQLHCAAYKQRAALDDIFGDRTFFEALRLEPYYAYTAERIPAAQEFLQELISETRTFYLTLVHGDYSPKNVLVQDGRLVLLDHEVIHIGDPAFDLGFSLTHLLSKAHHLSAHREAFTAAAHLYVQKYLSELEEMPWREGLEARTVRHVMSCLLARVAGRSPLEYLTPEQRQRQQSAVVSIMTQPPETLPTLIDVFLAVVSP